MCGLIAAFTESTALEPAIRLAVQRMHRRGPDAEGVFQGYESFQYLPRMVERWQALSRVPGVQALGKLAGGLQARRSGNARWRHAADWARTIGGDWWLRRSLHAPEDLPVLIGNQMSAEALRGFEAGRWVDGMTGALPVDGKLALGQIESSTYLRNQLLRDSDWASMDHSVELRTPLVDARLLQLVQPLLANFARFPGKSLLAEALDKPLPRSVTERRKTGFGIPVGTWLGANRADIGMRGWARQLVSAYDETRA